MKLRYHIVANKKVSVKYFKTKENQTPVFRVTMRAETRHSPKFLPKIYCLDSEIVQDHLYQNNLDNGFANKVEECTCLPQNCHKKTALPQWENSRNPFEQMEKFRTATNSEEWPKNSNSQKKPKRRFKDFYTSLRRLNNARMQTVEDPSELNYRFMISKRPLAYLLN